MPVTADQLTEPVGPLAPSLFPGDTPVAYTGRLAAYLTDAEARVAGANLSAADADAAVVAWAEYRAWKAVAVRLTATPATASFVDQGARTNTTEQLRQAVANREAALAAFRALLPDAAEPPGLPSAARHPGASGSTPIVYAHW